MLRGTEALRVAIQAVTTARARAESLSRLAGIPQLAQIAAESAVVGERMLAILHSELLQVEVGMIPEDLYDAACGIDATPSKN